MCQYTKCTLTDTCTGHLLSQDSFSFSLFAFCLRHVQFDLRVYPGLHTFVHRHLSVYVIASCCGTQPINGYAVKTWKRQKRLHPPPCLFWQSVTQ